MKTYLYQCPIKLPRIHPFHELAFPLLNELASGPKMAERIQHSPPPRYSAVFRRRDSQRKHMEYYRAYDDPADRPVQVQSVDNDFRRFSYTEKEYLKRRSSKAQKKQLLWIRVVKAVFSHIGLSIMVIAYLIGGAFIFQHLEATNEEIVCATGQFAYRQLTNATIDLINDLINSNDKTDEEKKSELRMMVDKFRRSVQNGTFSGPESVNCATLPKEWGWTGSLLFSVTVVTTIGYGHIAPKTRWGRMVCTIYAMLGIPLMLMMLANIGELLADIFRFIYVKMCCCGVCKRKNTGKNSEDINIERQEILSNHGNEIFETPSENYQEEDEENDFREAVIPLTVIMGVMALWIIFGATLFGMTEGWGMSHGCYYSFITVSTIGLGDVVPGIEGQSADTGAQMKLIMTVMYMLVGMAMLSMCFTLMQDEVMNKATWLGKKLGFVKNTEDGQNVGRQQRRETEFRINAWQDNANVIQGHDRAERTSSRASTGTLSAKLRNRAIVTPEKQSKENW